MQFARFPSNCILTADANCPKFWLSFQVKLLRRDSVTLRPCDAARLDASRRGRGKTGAFSPAGEIEQQLQRGESSKQKIRALVANVKCRHQSNYRFLSGGNEGTTTTTTSTRVERRGERSTKRVCRAGTGGSASRVGGRISSAKRFSKVDSSNFLEFSRICDSF